MDIKKQIKILEKNIKKVYCPEMIFEMNKKYRELTEQINLKN